MGAGYLHVTATAAKFSSIPIPNAKVTVSQGSKVLYQLITDENGNCEKVEISAPDKALTLEEGYTGEPYGVCDVKVEAPGYATMSFKNVKILDTETSLLSVNMTPDAASDTINYGHNVSENTTPESEASEGKGSTKVTETDGGTETFDLGKHQLTVGPERDKQEYAKTSPKPPRLLPNVIIPTYITVHLGSPSSNATNVTVPFSDYIKNVCANEIYATWPEDAIRANVLCQISLALNRVYTEWYPSRGYNFDITNNTAYDQYFVYGSNTYENINNIVDEIFNNYVQREGHKEPYYTEYCDGVIAQCPGLKQWGTLTLAEQGYSPIEILKYYYPDDIQIVESNNFQDIEESYPGYTLKEGMNSSDIKLMQEYLNRIRVSFPAIPQIKDPNGYYGPDTAAAVKAFQQIEGFGLNATGQVDKATWYKISYIYTGGVKKLAELASEGEVIGVGRTAPTVTVQQWDRGTNVGRLQYMLNFIAEFYPEIPYSVPDYNFDSDTLASVKAFQKAFNLTQDGVVGPGTWQKIYDVYWDIMDNIDLPPVEDSPIAYPGSPLSVGSSGEAVQQLQKCLNNISANYPSIGKISEDGLFGNGTKAAVIAFQSIFGITQDGIVGPTTWNKIIQECSSSGSGSNPSYPGYALRYGSSGESVLKIQSCLNNISNSYPSIPKLTEDGKFGAGTERAIIEFQRLFGLTQDGVVGQATWSKIISLCQTSSSQPAYPGYLIALGSSGDYVKQIQQCLNNISSRYPSISTLTADGVYGNGTRNSVVEFQRIFGLTQDGIIGKSTWDKIMQECSYSRKAANNKTVSTKSSYSENSYKGATNTKEPSNSLSSNILKFFIVNNVLKNKKPRDF
ncbi:MAG: peptidoglycan-binding protein [Clostridiales bacterium]|jgi:peptidoglycan hydrolase-like protein with peptidoglycan-binding domain|nr:peptidoglycan-binding protein [Clostridiales bacterium]